MVKEFREFLIKGNVMDLAVAVIIGGAFGAIVTSLVNDVIMPIIGLLLGGRNFDNLFISLDGSTHATLAAAQEAGAATLNYGLFINAIINFVIIGFVIFMLVKQVNKMTPPPPAPPAGPSQEELLAEIRDLLKK